VLAFTKAAVVMHCSQQHLLCDLQGWDQLVPEMTSQHYH
jgi:hypothetical protein